MRTGLTALGAAALLALATTFAAAHSKGEGTTPADGAVLETAPETIALKFDAPMRVTLLSLTHADGTEIALARDDGMKPVTDLSAVPSDALAPGAYTVAWRGLSADGHPMEGRFSFEVAD